jgi:glutamate-1-semialdehyde 2,1-aminomutase
VKRGAGAYLYDTENESYIDYIGSWGALVLGHAHPQVVKAVQQAAESGLSFGAPTEAESEMAHLLCQLVPGVEQVRLVNSGTEATMTAIRLARGYTGRNRIIKFEGCYHGHADPLLVKAGSGALALAQPSSAGVPPFVSNDTIVLPYNDAEELQRTFKAIGKEIAAVIIEPVAGNMNLIKPAVTFLETLRDLCTQYETVLIFDEVMTGFRVGLKGAQKLFDIYADLITLGKVIGGGMPVGAVGGRREIMNSLAPLGPVYQAGTLSGNPIAVAAGLATLKLVQAENFYSDLANMTEELVHGLIDVAKRNKVIFSAQSVGGMFGIYFRFAPPHSYEEVMQCDKEKFNRFFHAMLDHGVYLAPSAYEAGFVSAAHKQSEIDKTLEAADKSFKMIA